jgi:hypothetical protein
MLPTRNCFFGLVVVLAAGCGGAPQEDRDVSKIKWIVTSGVGDAAKQPGIFDADVSKQEMARYAEFQFQPVGTPDIKGDTATAKVQAKKGETVAGEVEWTFVRKDGAWKIKSAPLPK